MARFLTILFGGGVMVALMVLALAAWFQAPIYAAAAERPDVLRWAMRSGAIAAAAGAQVIALSLVVGKIYQAAGAHKAVRFLAAVVCCIAAVSAAALGVAARG
jgi:hypothetical protein